MTDNRYAMAVLISIHAPSRERLLHYFCTSMKLNFNPRSLAGATKAVADKPPTEKISIHAPSRERRSTIITSLSIRGISIHAPSRERLGSGLYFCFSSSFQSTLPRGSDCSAALALTARIYFNPRSLAGATPGEGVNSSVAVISIHAPSRERRQTPEIYLKRHTYFNPRSLAGATFLHHARAAE